MAQRYKHRARIKRAMRLYLGEQDNQDNLACHKALSMLLEGDAYIIRLVYSSTNSWEDTVRDIARSTGISQNAVWSIIRDFERLFNKYLG